MKTKLLFFLIIVGLCASCSQTKEQNTEVVIKADDYGIFVPVTIGDTVINFFLDTGSSITTIGSELAKKLDIAYDSTKITSVDTFKSNFGEEDELNPMACGTYDYYLAEKTKINIGNIVLACDLLITHGLDSLPLLGTDITSKFYSAIHITDKRLALSSTPLSFEDYVITDSVEFIGTHSFWSKNMRHMYKVKVGSVFLNLLLDTGMRSGMSFKDKSFFPFDIKLVTSDSLGVSAKMFNDIVKRVKFQGDYHNKVDQMRVYSFTCDSLFSLNSYEMISYIPIYINDVNISDKPKDGYITYNFLARFDIAYYDPYSRVMKLYKLKGYESLRNDIPLRELLKMGTKR